MGNVINPVDTRDVPVDNNQCTSDVCTLGTPSNPANLSGMACSQPPGNHICSNETGDNGTCVQCNAITDCPGDETLCHTRTCVNHICGVFHTPDGTLVGTQAPGDCRKSVCSGDIVVSQDDTLDVPADDGNPCSAETCTGSNPAVPSHPTAPQAGLTCAGKQGGRCDTGGVCVPTFMVLRVGDGSAVLSSAATAGFVERRYFDSLGGLVLGSPIAVRIAADGAQQPLTFSGTATSDGALSLSDNGSYVTFAGYGAMPGLAGVASTATATVNRIVGRVTAADAIDTSTRLDVAFTGNNVRGATSTDGSVFWVSGNGTGQGVYTIPFQTTGGTGILAAPANTRVSHVFKNQLYVSSDRNNFASVSTVGGTPPPTAVGQTATVLPGLPTANTGSPSPFSFAFFDTDGDGATDTLYLTDDRAPGPLVTNGGIQKWKLVSGTWTFVTTFSQGLTTGVRGVAGLVTVTSSPPYTVMLLATTAEASANKVVMYVDNGVDMNPAQTLVTTAGTNTVFRGLALAP
jgi:hypothetical protein